MGEAPSNFPAIVARAVGYPDRAALARVAGAAMVLSDDIETRAGILAAADLIADAALAAGFARPRLITARAELEDLVFDAPIGTVIRSEGSPQTDGVHERRRGVRGWSSGHFGRSPEELAHRWSLCRNLQVTVLYMPGGVEVAGVAPARIEALGAARDGHVTFVPKSGSAPAVWRWQGKRVRGAAYALARNDGLITTAAQPGKSVLGERAARLTPAGENALKEGQ